MAPKSVDAASAESLPDWDASGNSTDASLSEALITLRKRRLVLVVAVLLGLCFGVYKIITQPRLYDSYGRIEVRSGSSSEYKIDPTQLLGGNSDVNKLASEVAILQSDTLLLTVARELDLCNNPDFLGVKGPVPQRSLNDLAVRESTLKRIQSELKVALVPKTDLIRISYSSLSAKLSADIVNKLISDYIQRSYETRYLSTQRVSQWLSGQLDDLKKQVELSQEHLLEIQRRLGISGLDPTHAESTGELQALSAAVANARVERIIAESKYRAIQGNDPDTIEDASESGNNSVKPVLTQLRTQLATLEAQLALASTTMGPNNPQIRSQKSQIAALKKQVDAEQSRLLNQAKENYIIARNTEDRTAAALEQQKAEAYKLRDDVVEYTLRQRDFESNRLLYEGLLLKLRTAGVEAGLESLEVDIVDQAMPAARPTLERRSTILLTYLIAGLILGAIAAFVLESLDTGLKSIAEIEALTGLPSLAIVPRNKRMTAEETSGMTIAQKNISVLSSPKSQFAEALRSLRTSLLLSTTGHPPKYIVFTSATPSEGKTTVSTNTACILAQGDTRVLLIDADLRRPNVHPRFGVSSKVGLSTLLTGTSTFDETIQRIPEVPNLDIIASGPVPPFPAELLSSDAMKSLLARCSELYEYIVIDSPPILSVTDGVILARDADAVVLVVRHGKSGKHIVRRARDLLIRAGAPITGIVLNAVDLNSPEYQGYYGQSGYHYSGVDTDSWEPKRGDGDSSSNQGPNQGPNTGQNKGKRG